MDKCIGIIGLLFGHKFTALITKSSVKGAPRVNGVSRDVHRALDAHRDESYHGIYCKRCGKVINA